MRLFLLICVVACLVAATPSYAAEIIRNYDVKAVVQPDGVVDVTENILVNVENNQIKHGIYRDFPTEYRDKAGNKVSIPFDIKDISRGGFKEPYHTMSLTNGVRVLIGDKDRYVEQGPQYYTIHYQVYKVIGRFPDAEEFYWNVTGNGWAFPIEKAHIQVVLPENTPILATAAYTGRMGQSGKDYRLQKSGHVLDVWTTKFLNSYEGLTIAVDFPTGTIQSESIFKYYWMLLQTHKALAIFVGMLLAAIIFNSIAWFITGREIPIGPIIPRFDLMEDVTPDLLRYVYKQSYDDKTLSCFIVQQAVEGRIRMTEGGEDLLLERKNTPKPMTEAEKMVLEALFSTGNTLSLPKSKSLGFMPSTIQKEKRRELAQQMQGVKSLHEQVFSSDFVHPVDPDAGLLDVSAYALTKASNTMSKIFSYDPEADFFSIAPLVNFFRVAIIILSVLVNFYVTGLDSDMMWATIVAQIGVFYIFRQPMKRYSSEGQEIYEYGKGLKLYLSVAEQARLDANYPKDITPEIFENFLPYALALDVEQKWCDRFAQCVAASGIVYASQWYSGNYGGLSHMGRNLGSALETSISSASTPPGSSRGGGGGGFSGGGGGGGGGGGW